MTQVRDALQTSLNDVIPEDELAPWVLQIYVQDEPSLARFAESLCHYPDARHRGSAFTQHQQAVMRAHLARISRPGGLFNDTAVTGSAWQGQRRVVRATLFRRLPAGVKAPPALEVVASLNEVASKWSASLATAGVRAHRVGGQALYEWLLCWFNPAASTTSGDHDALLKVAPYPGDTV
jgi:hypothetical protein